MKCYIAINIAIDIYPVTKQQVIKFQHIRLLNYLKVPSENAKLFI